MQPIIRWIFFPITLLNTKKFTRLLIQDSPDVIISTHFLASEIAAFLKRDKKINSKIITVITDFGVHPFWIQEGTDIYTAASDITRAKLIAKGISEEKIKVIGIPVHAGFSKKSEKNELCSKLNIKENKFTVLVLTGSFGIGPLEKIVEMLYRDAQVLVVCARNKKLFAKLKNKKYAQVSVFGFVDEIYDFMSVSDIVITKPGGLTVSELLVMELAPIFISAIPGQETENVKALRAYGIGSLVKNASDVRGKALDYKLNPEKLKRVRENIRLIRKPNTLEDLYHVIC
jgi:processive 1,2-diacylglycerol beta-glucosyltransferase